MTKLKHIAFPFVLTLCLLVEPAVGTCVRLNWTATGDDITVGQACFYDLRFSTDSLFLLNNFDQATEVGGLHKPQTAGAEESFIVPGLQSGAKYYFALKVADEALNWSELSNVVARIAFDDECFEPQACLQADIGFIPNAYLGQYYLIDISAAGSDMDLSGFDLLIGYDPSALMLINARPGALLAECGWEYFSYNLTSAGGCAECPSQLLRVTARAEINNGPFHASCFLKEQYGPIVSLDILVGGSAALVCRSFPISFYWLTCEDNSFLSADGETRFTSREVIDGQGNSITDPSYGLPGPYGISNSCLVYQPDKQRLLRCADLRNGGVSISCSDSVSSRGDVSLNGVPFEITDAVLFTNYFIYGLGVFNIDIQRQIAATDINGDGIRLSVADLVLLVRIVGGDLGSGPKLAPASDDIIVDAEHSPGRMTLSTETNGDIGAALFVYDIAGDMKVQSVRTGGSADRMDILWAEVDGQLRILLYSLEDQLVEPGANDLIEISYVGNGNLSLASSEIVDYNGRPYLTVNKGPMLPTGFGLEQNYPNPFNPSTVINFSLPVASDWTLTIYNIIGKQVKQFSGSDDPGRISLVWNGLDSQSQQVASGIYLYRLRAGKQSLTRKMILLK